MGAEGESFAGQPASLSPYDVFVDLSSTDLDEAGVAAVLAVLAHGCGYGEAAGRITFSLPPGVDADAPMPVDAFRLALAAATRERRHLLVILGRALPPNEVVRPLIEALADDPLVGITQPRFAEDRTGAILPIGEGKSSPRLATILPDTLAHLPHLTITAEHPAAVMLLRWDVVECSVVPQGLQTALGAIVGVLVGARRRGFRNGILSRAVVSVDPISEDPYPTLTGSDLDILVRIYPEMAIAMEENRRLPLRRYEPLVDAVRRPKGRGRRLLVDCRSLSPIHNGTSRANLGMLEGLTRASSDWEIDVLVRSEVAAYHNIAERFPGLQIVDGPKGFYAASYTPNQPWTLEILADLHRVSGVLVYSMLDTIAWDIVTPTPGLTDVWRAAARFIDGLTFISSFSRDRFVRRFAPQASTLMRVVHLSLNGAENTLPKFRGGSPGEHILILGNTYDHKALAPTIEMLLRARPLSKFVVLGLDRPSTARVTYLPSGQVTAEQVHQLVATARAVVFPSYYEGFGLPPVEGLAYGRDVLVRRSTLWEEIAAHAQLPGRLIPFEDARSLAETLDRVLAGSEVQIIPQGAAVSVAPTDWAAHARETLAMIEVCLEGFDAERWRARDEAFQLLSYRGS